MDVRRTISSFSTSRCSVWLIILSFFLLSFSCSNINASKTSRPKTSPKVFTNEFIVHIPNGKNAADNLAYKYGFINQGQIGEIEDHFLFVQRKLSKRSVRESVGHHSLLKNDPEVHWIEQQYIKKRVKRDYPLDLEFNDPQWSRQWYLNRNNAPTMNVERAWRMGYTGNGVVVSILDDGIEMGHPDLRRNYDPDASQDINDRDADPTPRYDTDNSNKHGTRCAGEVAMEAGNGVCGVGVAYNASIGGIRMLDGDITDAIESMSLSARRKHIDIYSASWGPEDDGATVEGPGPMAKKAFKEGARKGRKGLGSIFVWASGNGGRMDDSCSCDGFVNSIYTISVSSTSEYGAKPWYLEECSSTLATTYSSGSGTEQRVSTSDLHHMCTNRFTGTSASAPIAAGMCALALEANSNLSWRDLQYIIVLSSTNQGLDGDWVTNAAGHDVSLRYGFGLMDAAGMVTLALDWEKLPDQRRCIVNGQPTRKLFNGGDRVLLPIQTSSCINTSRYVRYLEHVQVNISLRLHSRGDVSITLISPLGTRSVILPYRPSDVWAGDFDNWEFMSTHFWGERAEGEWTLEINSQGPKVFTDQLLKWQIVLRGTEALPEGIPNSDTYSGSHTLVRLNAEEDYSWSSDDYWSSYDDDDLYPIVCHKECRDSSGCYGSLANQCFDCKNYIDRETRACVPECPLGFFAPLQVNRRCRRCSDNCLTCYGHEPTECLSCRPGYFYQPIHTSCEERCEPGQYEDRLTSTCQQCNRLCNACADDSDNCFSCIQGALWQTATRTCTLECAIDEYLKDETCMLCDPTCASCHGPRASDCLTCDLQYVHKEGTCIEESECLDDFQGYYVDTDVNECYPCHATCRECVGGEPDDCIDCKDGHFLEIRPDSDFSGRCLQRCSKGTYLNVNGVCQDCPYKCDICFRMEYDQFPECILCEEDYVIFEGICVEGCQQGYFQRDSDCLPCHPLCSACSGEGVTDCLQCNNTNQFEPNFLLDGACVPFCPSNGFFQNDDEFLCESCDETCLKCSGITYTECTACETYELLLNGSCIEQTDQSSDDTCAEGCSTCLQDVISICFTCKPTFYSHLSLCVHECPLGFYGQDGDDPQCIPCHATCKTCYDRSSRGCTSCNVHYKWIKQSADSEMGLCDTFCPEGYYEDNDVCLPCDPTCESCNGPHDSSCLGCSGDRYYKASTSSCVNECGDLFFKDEISHDCRPCHPSCKTCTGPQEFDCVSCKGNIGVTDRRCLTDCSLGQYMDGQSCSYCHPTCLTCDGPGAEECLSCDYYYFLSASSYCLINCPDGFYEDFEQNVCRPCHTSCATCTDAGEENCLDCAEDYYLLLSLSSQNCVQQCPQGYYESIDEGFNDCRRCSLSCRDCAINYLQCTSCDDGYFLYQARCQTTCPQGFEKDQTSNQCIRKSGAVCPLHCNECDEWGDCSDCAEEYEIFFGECLRLRGSEEVCPEGQFRTYANSIPTCSNCADNCAVCLDEQETSCIECKGTFRLTPSGRCKESCTEKHYFDEIFEECRFCHPSCSNCNGPSPFDCTTCHLGAQLNERNKCVIGCPHGTFSSDSNCLPCHKNCSTCSGANPTDCLSCSGGKYYYGGQCLAQCVNGTYHYHPEYTRDGFECRACHSNCKTCFDQTEDSCTSCKKDMVRLRHTCISQCPDGYYVPPEDPDRPSDKGKQLCQPCHSTCEKCDGPLINDCLKCSRDLFLDKDAKQCQDQCPEHTFATEMEGKFCENCHETCRQCNESTPFDCIKCFDGFELDEGVCFSRCLTGFYYDANAKGSQADCKICDPICEGCYGHGSSKCLSCADGHVLQRLDENNATCTICCSETQNADVDDCCKCNSEGRCPGLKFGRTNSKKKPSGGIMAHIGGILLGCVALILCFIIVFGVLQARSHRHFCWKNSYAQLPTYYDSGNQFVQLGSDPKYERDEDYFSEEMGEDEDVYGEITDEDEEQDEYNIADL